VRQLFPKSSVSKEARALKTKAQRERLTREVEALRPRLAKLRPKGKTSAQIIREARRSD
jgi:hypothetical protein